MDRPLFSDMLAERRRELGFSIRQASRVLRLREDVLFAFEEGDFEQIPKSGYAQGMLSSYARYLGLDANEVVDAFLADQERYNRAQRHNRHADGPHPITSGFATNQYGERVGQPYVRSRGLLPTSGGKAGDLGSFGTTRVRPRYVATDDSDFDDAELAPSGYETYPQGRPYTARTPRTGVSSTGEIRTLGYEQFDYTDDLAPSGNDAWSYQSASSAPGRRSSRHIGDTSRPQVSRRGERAGQGRRQSVSRPGRTSSRGGGRQQRSGKRRTNRSRRKQTTLNLPILAIGAAVIVLISVVIVLSVSSCVSHGTDSRTVPVSAATDQGQTTTTDTTAPPTSSAPPAATDTQTTEQQPGQSSTSTSTTTGTASGDAAETSVSVSVAEGAVTWLEVECDGVSDVAETVTGAWQRTYTVEDSITVQAGDTTAVSVVQDGRQVQFDSMASGIGTVRIQGTKKSQTKKTSSSEGATSATTAKMGNNAPRASEDASDTDGEEDGYDEDSY